MTDATAEHVLDVSMSDPNLRHIEEALCRQITTKLQETIQEAASWCADLFQNATTEVVVVVLPSFADGNHSLTIR